MEVFMDDFSMVGDDLEECLSNLHKVLQRCKETNWVLILDKCYFVVNDVIVLGHKISKSDFEVDRAKPKVIEKLRPPIPTREVRSFLGHVGLYQRFIKDFSKLTILFAN